MSNNGVWIVRDKLDDNLPIWKYIKYKHFHDLIIRQALYFNPITHLQQISEPEGDQKEGTDTETNSKIKNEVRMENLAKMRKLGKIIEPKGLTWDNFYSYDETLRKQYDANVYVCYFHINDKENLQMGERHRNEESVAIKSTYGKVIHSLQPTCYIGINPVYYVTEDQITR